MLRPIAIIIVAAACVGAGATAGLVVFASEFRWPLSDANFEYCTHLGAYWGIAGALIAAVCLSKIDRKYLWMAGAIAVGITWLVTFAGVWSHMVRGLG